jgi:hypothetical protein
MTRGFSGRRARLCATAIAVGVVVGGVGCGEDDGDDAAAEQLTVSAASEPPQNFMRRMAKLIETSTTRKDCDALADINGRSLIRFACPTNKKLRESMASFEVVGAEEYGTGAVVDYKSGTVKDGAAILLFTNGDRQWGVSRFGVIVKPSTGTDDGESRDGYAETAEDFVDAVRDRNCRAYAAATFTDGAKPPEVCRSQFAATEDLGRALKRNPDADPRYLGGNATFGFFSLELAKPKPTNLTVSVVKSGDKSVVLNAAPSQTLAEQREAARALRRQQRQRKAPGGMQPSTKSDPIS